MKGLTDRQREIINYLYDFRQRNGYSATYREIADHFGFSTKAAFDHIKALEKKGMIQTSENTSRSNKILLPDMFDPEDAMVTIPVLGRVACGPALLAEEQQDGEISIPCSLLAKRNAKYYAMRATGESMIDMGIMEGDILIIEQCETAQSGDVVMASYNEDYGVTLKQIYFYKDRIELRGANPNFKPILSSHCKIYGKLALSIRQY